MASSYNDQSYTGGATSSSSLQAGPALYYPAQSPHNPNGPLENPALVAYRQMIDYEAMISNSVVQTAHVATIPPVAHTRVGFMTPQISLLNGTINHFRLVHGFWRQPDFRYQRTSNVFDLFGNLGQTFQQHQQSSYSGSQNNYRRQPQIPRRYYITQRMYLQTRRTPVRGQEVSFGAPQLNLTSNHLHAIGYRQHELDRDRTQRTKALPSIENDIEIPSDASHNRFSPQRSHSLRLSEDDGYDGDSESSSHCGYREPVAGSECDSPRSRTLSPDSDPDPDNPPECLLKTQEEMEMLHTAIEACDSHFVRLQQEPK